jgi:hypothetical protein
MDYYSMVAGDTTNARRDVLPRILKSIHWQTKQSNHEVMLNRSHGNKTTKTLQLLGFIAPLEGKGLKVTRRQVGIRGFCVGLKFCFVIFPSLALLEIQI